MQIILAIWLTLHGLCHLMVFFVTWEFAHMEEMPYKTTVFNGSINLGKKGIRVYGLIWLMMVLAFLGLAIAVVLQLDWWPPLSYILGSASLVLSIISWPDAKIITFFSLLILLLIPYAVKAGWIS